ncbi:hypothetical protein TNIN_417541 [Trichonephila inaurata madagascariensis]|uniref:Uncharacterized protein n=1 Tax=Trichonephila inaurata madagascariensis TaxID=2747483 RepID=A0A8X6Y2C4_9ARAC|nr:hypothetical protein TNIN_417541 [Trichonephila inaurata madagascariensis]
MTNLSTRLENISTGNGYDPQPSYQETFRYQPSGQRQPFRESRESTSNKTGKPSFRVESRTRSITYESRVDDRCLPLYDAQLHVSFAPFCHPFFRISVSQNLHGRVPITFSTVEK